VATLGVGGACRAPPTRPAAAPANTGEFKVEIGSHGEEEEEL